MLTCNYLFVGGTYKNLGFSLFKHFHLLQAGEETQRITRDGAVWAVAFSKTCLLVTDWNEGLSFYNMQGQQVHKERNIGIHNKCH